MGNGQGRPCGSVRPAGRPTRSIRWLSRVRRVLGRGLHSLGACLSPQDVLDDPVHLRQEIEALGHRIRQLEIAAAAASSVLLTLGPSRPETAAGAPPTPPPPPLATTSRPEAPTSSPAPVAPIPPPLSAPTPGPAPVPTPPTPRAPGALATSLPFPSAPCAPVPTPTTPSSPPASAASATPALGPPSQVTAPDHLLTFEDMFAVVDAAVRGDNAQWVDFDCDDSSSDFADRIFEDLLKSIAVN